MIYRVGEGTASLSTDATIVYLDEINPSTGKVVQSIAMPVKADTTNGINRLTASGTANSEGFLTLSADGQYLVLAGYDAATGTSSIAGSTSSTVGRTIGRVDWDGVIDTSTVLNDFASGSNPRGVVSTDGSEFWASGGTGGIRYAQLGDSKSTHVTSGGSTTNFRVLGIFDQQLYVSTASGSNPRIGTIGEGLPTVDGQVYSGLSGMITTGSAYGFHFFDLTTDVDGVDTLYVAFDDEKSGLRKFSFNGKEWTAADTNFTDFSAVRGLTGRIGEKGLVELFVVSSGAELVRVIDEAGWGEDFKASSEAIAKAESNTAFRGVAFAPQRFATITRNDPTPTNADSVTYTVVFREEVLDLDVDDFELTLDGKITDAAVKSVEGEGTKYTITVATGTGDGTLRLDIKKGASILDANKNTLTYTAARGEAYTIDKTAPTVSSVVRDNSTAQRTNATTVSFTVTFSEDVSGVDAGDFGIAVTGQIDAALVTNVSGTGSTYTVTVNAGTGNGTLGLNAVANGSIVDELNNPLQTGFTAGQVYTINRPVRPARVTLNVGEPRVLVGNTITLTATVQQQGTAGARSVTFKRGSMVLGTVPLDASKTASLDVSGLPVGTYVFTAHYNGDNETGPGSSTALSVQVVTRNGMFVYDAWNALTGLNNASVLPNYIAALEQGNTNRTQVVLQMQRTAPFFVANVQRTYQELLGRAPTATELNARVSLLAQGQTVPQLQIWLMSQPEYFLRRGAGTASGYLAAIARDLTRHVVSPTSRNALINTLMSTGVPLLPANLTNLAARQGFVANLFNSATGRTARVWDLFGRLQGTGADGRLSTFATLLQGPLGYNQVVAALVGSQTFAS